MMKIISIITIIVFTLSSLPLVGTAEAASKAMEALYKYKRGKSLYTPCQYKETYRYYMEKARAYYDDNQFESALLCLERALILQPNSDEARDLARLILERLRSKEDTMLTSVRKSALEKAMKLADEEPLPEKADEEEKKIVPPAKPKRRVAADTAEAEEIPAKRPEASQRSGYRRKEPLKISKRERRPYIAPEPKVEKEVEAKPEPKAIKSRRKPYISRDTKPEKQVSKPSVEQAKPSKRIFHIPTPEDFDDAYDEYIDPAAFSNGINDSIQKAGDSLNEAIEPNRIRGEYRVAFGATNDDILWKDANADYHNMPGDTSWRYIFGKDKHNSYDKKIYSRLKVEVDNPINENLKTYNELVIDPWTFVGKKRVFIRGSNGDNVEMDLKYWSNTGKTLNETYRTERGDIVNVNEMKIQDGKNDATTFLGLFDWGSNNFTVPEVDIDNMYVPLRKSWLEYANDPYKVKLFLMASQDEALTSDDPMRLSNNKIWWEESPWLDQYEPSRVFERAGVTGPGDYGRTREPVKEGRWVRRLSFVAKDSDDQFLTFLRGVSFNADFNGTTIDAVAAAPRNLWDSYDQATSLPAALRVKTPITDNLDIGGLYTLKAGFNHNSVEAVNNMFAVDSTYRVMPNTEILSEAAVSAISVDEAIGYNNKETGYASMVGIKNKGDLNILPNSENGEYELKAAFNHMDHRFNPGLSNYRLTRNEFEFAKHIHFDELKPENEAVKFGDGIDIGRNSFNLGVKAQLPETGLSTEFDYRNVHSDGGDFIENVFRSETTYKAIPKLTLKGLAFYKNLPKTTAGIDPLINAKNSYSAFTDYFADEDVWLENTAVQGGEDPSIGAFSAGMNYDFTDYFSGRAIVEATNDPKDWPRGLLNNTYVTDSYSEGVIWDRVVPLLYNQSVFGIPPYSYYGIYKSGVTYYPFKPLKVDLSYVYNENKYAMAIDDNSTHQGIELEYKPSSRMKVGFLYQYTRQRDIYKEQVLGLGHNYDGHHNIFGSLDYVINEDQHFTLMFGEYVGYNYNYPESHAALTALDTQHIIRVSYSGSWGEPRGQRLESSLDNSWAPLGSLNPAIPGAAFTTSLYAGVADYEMDADIVPVESGWEAGYTKLEFGVDAYDKEYVEGSLKFGLFGSLENEESWNRSGAGTYQRNDMDFRGADINANIGIALNKPEKYITFTPLINAGYRRMEFERTNALFQGAGVPELGEVDDVYNISFLGIGGKIDWLMSKRLDLYTSGYWAPFVYTSYKNDAIGSIAADNGNIWHAESGCDYTINDRFDVTVGGFWDKQNINSAQRIDAGVVSAELPESNLKVLGLKFGGLYRF
ncbi:MAG: hypothetical protein ABH843_03635 [Candidatus Omnitrophota bacterium]